MACGVPVVVTVVGDSAFIAEDAGVVVPIQDPDALAAAINGLLRLSAHDRQLRISRARQRISENFSVDALCRRSEMILKELHAKK